MNKSGYTMVELLAVIAIIGLLFTIATVSYSSLINKSNNTVYESYRDSMHMAIQTYVIDNPIKDISEEKDATITLQELINKKKIDYINNPKDSNDKCDNSYIDINRNDVDGVVNYEYKVCLICNDYNEETFKDKSCEWKYMGDKVSNISNTECGVVPNNPNEGDKYCKEKIDIIQYGGSFHCIDYSGRQATVPAWYDTLSECQNAVPRGCDRRVTLRECNINIHDYYSIYQYTCTTTINGSNCKTYSN